MKSIILARIKTELNLSYKDAQFNESDGMIPNKSMKLTHWPSRYKKGIQIVQKRKVSQTVGKNKPKVLLCNYFNSDTIKNCENTACLNFKTSLKKSKKSLNSFTSQIKSL